MSTGITQRIHAEITKCISTANSHNCRCGLKNLQFEHKFKIKTTYKHQGHGDNHKLSTSRTISFFDKTVQCWKFSAVIRLMSYLFRAQTV
jgi:hypothetical protein